MAKDETGWLEEFIKSAEGQEAILKVAQQLWDKAQSEKSIESGDIITGHSSCVLHGLIRRWALASRDARWN